MPDIPKPMLSGIFLQIHLLVLYAVRFASLLVISGKSFIQGSNLDWFFFVMVFNLPSMDNQLLFVVCNAPFFYLLIV